MRVRVLSMVVLSVVSAVLVGQQAAFAGGERATATCSFNIPAKLVVRAPDSDVMVSFGKDCPANTQRAWWSSVPGYLTVVMEKPGGTSWVPLEFTEIGKPTKWTGDPRGALARGGTKVADLRPAYTMTKCASAARLSGVRRGGKTTLTASASYYSLKAKTFIRWHGRLQLQYLDGRTWKSLAYVTPNAAGVARYTLATNRSRSYRVYAPSTGSVWFSYSSAVKV